MERGGGHLDRAIIPMGLAVSAVLLWTSLCHPRCCGGAYEPCGGGQEGETSATRDLGSDDHLASLRSLWGLRRCTQAASVEAEAWVASMEAEAQTATSTSRSVRDDARRSMARIACARW